MLVKELEPLLGHQKAFAHVFEQMDAIKPLGGKALQTTGELIPDPFC